MRYWLAWVLLAAGCMSAERQRLEVALRQPAQPDSIARDRYVLHCPDRIEITINSENPWRGERVIGVDGRIELGEVGLVRIQGQTIPEARRTLANLFGTPYEQVRLQVLDYLSQQVFVHGQVEGADRALPYRGPETVLEILQRAGGLESGAAVTEVSVVRGHIAEGRSTEVFEVDLKGILLRNESRTNIRVEPFDQIYIGQSRRSLFCSRLPPILRPFWEYFLGIRQPGPEPNGAVPAPSMAKGVFHPLNTDSRSAR